MNVNVLGTEYKIIFNATESEYPKIIGLSGYTDFSVKKIVIRKPEQSSDSMEDLKVCENDTLKHEIIHAFLFESGLDNNSWGRNEEVIDWIALQFEKMLDTFTKLNIIKISSTSLTVNLESKLDKEKNS